MTVVTPALVSILLPIILRRDWASSLNHSTDSEVYRIRCGDSVISLFRGRRLGELVLKTLENIPLGSQTFVPLSGTPYLAAVAPAGEFDTAKIRLFRAEGTQGVHYSKGTWHHFLLVLDECDFLVVDRVGPGDNCEEVELDAKDVIRVRE